MRHSVVRCGSSFFFFNDTATTEIYTLSLHDALPISAPRIWRSRCTARTGTAASTGSSATSATLARRRSEEHTSELQSQSNLVCRLLLEKKKKNHLTTQHPVEIVHLMRITQPARSSAI